MLDLITAKYKLPLPSIVYKNFGNLRVLTDNLLFEKTGVRVAFTGRNLGSCQNDRAGISTGYFSALNLGDRCGDDSSAVDYNRQLALTSLGAISSAGLPYPLINPHQVHGSNIISVENNDYRTIDKLKFNLLDDDLGCADGVIVKCPEISAMLCFADCVPVVMVAPNAMFCVVHAGWRGVINEIWKSGFELLCEAAGADARDINIYIGPHIGGCCFEVGGDVARKFERKFGCVAGCEVVRPIKSASDFSCEKTPQFESSPAPNTNDKYLVDLSAALRQGFESCGAHRMRIVDAHECTMCSPKQYFSYRFATKDHQNKQSLCGRHAAIVFANPPSASGTPLYMR